MRMALSCGSICPVLPRENWFGMELVLLFVFTSSDCAIVVFDEATILM